MKQASVVVIIAALCAVLAAVLLWPRGESGRPEQGVGAEETSGVIELPFVPVE